MATQIKFESIPLKIEQETPREGIILITPYVPHMLRDKKDQMYSWGSVKRSGYMAINGKPIEGWDYMGSTLSIDSSGMSLNLANETQRRLYMIFKYADQWRGVVSERKDKRYSAASKFYFQNNEAEIKEWLEDKRREDELVDRIRGLNAGQLERLSLWFSIKGTDDFKKGTLRKMTETAHGRQQLNELIQSPDRDLMELVAVAEEKGDPNKKLGLWKNRTSSIYYWNNEAMGVGREGAIIYLKKNHDLQNELRNMYLGQTAPAQVPTQQPVVVKTPVAKVLKPEKKKFEKPAIDTSYLDMEAVIAAYKEGMTNFYHLGQKFTKPDGSPTHHKTLQRLLKEAGILD